jgi:hypothetical protein
MFRLRFIYRFIYRPIHRLILNSRKITLLIYLLGILNKLE